MISDITHFQKFQVFLNYPFDEDFVNLSNAMHFAVVSAGLVPVCAKDLSLPDKPRLEMLVEAIINCNYSAHDFSRYKGEGSNRMARFNVPIEMGMALFHALETQRTQHRCAFFVYSPHDHTIFASDLAGLDPKLHNNDELEMLTLMYEWLRAVSKNLFAANPTKAVREEYLRFKEHLLKVDGSHTDGAPTHDEIQEVMFQICSDCEWWDFRDNRAGLDALPKIPISWKE